MTEDARKALVYDESRRAITQQQTALDALRTRTGVVIAAASIASSFLGAQALNDHPAFSIWSWLAIVAFGVVGVAAISVLWPRKNWFFSNNVDTLLSGYVEGEEPASLDEMHVDVAEYNQKHWNENQEKLTKMYVAFQIACGALVLEIAFWLIDLGTG